MIVGELYSEIEHEPVCLPLSVLLQKRGGKKPVGVHGSCRSLTSLSWSCDRISISVMGEAACLCSSMSHTFAHTRSHFPYLEKSPQLHPPLWENIADDNAAVFAFCRDPRAPASPLHYYSTRCVSTSKITRWVKKSNQNMNLFCPFLFQTADLSWSSTRTTTSA